MNAPVAADTFDSMKFAVGQPVPRQEDPTLLRGQGRYTDDINEPGQAYAYIVRSQYAHGVLKSISVDEAKRMPGVLAVYTAKDLAAYGPHKCALDFKQRDGSPMPKAPAALSLESLAFIRKLLQDDAPWPPVKGVASEASGGLF